MEVWVGFLLGLDEKSGVRRVRGGKVGADKSSVAATSPNPCMDRPDQRPGPASSGVLPGYREMTCHRHISSAAGR